MVKKVVSTSKNAYKKGQILQLDSIYEIQGCADNWFEFVEDDEERVIITKNITIEIKVTEG